jgi:pyruvate kinase
VSAGDRLYLNDGLVQLVVERVTGNDVECTVAVGGELRSRKGLNLPGIQLGIRAFTEHDRACLEVALQAGVDAVSQSFVERASDLQALRAEAARLGADPSSSPRSSAPAPSTTWTRSSPRRTASWWRAGTWGGGAHRVHGPVQKQIIAAANLAAKPVITATQMLESMVTSRLPTRAEATDVANAILDGTDAVMLSGESATGRFPEEAVTMLGRIAAFTEAHRPRAHAPVPKEQKSDRMAALVEHAVETVPCDAVLVPSRTGATARSLARYKPRVWIVAPCRDPGVGQGLVFSYGVHPLHLAHEPGDWREFARGVAAERVLLVTGPTVHDPQASYRVELLQLARATPVP